MLMRTLGEKNGERGKTKIIFFVLVALIVAAVVYFAIYCFFFFHIGFPSSQGQDSSALVLTDSDWLSFLGSYLTFAGALIMAYLVYRQNKKITELTIADHEPKIALRITNIFTEKAEETLIYTPPKDSQPYLALLFDAEGKEGYEEDEDKAMFIFADIRNVGKTPIKSISFETAELVPVEDGAKKTPKGYKYTKRVDKGWDPLDKKSSIYPNECLKRCFRLNKFPKKTDRTNYWMTLKLVDDTDSPFSEEVFITESNGNWSAFE